MRAGRAPDSSAWIAPRYLIVDDFLDADERAELVEWPLGNVGSFQPTDYDNVDGTAVRRSVAIGARDDFASGRALTKIRRLLTGPVGEWLIGESPAYEWESMEFCATGDAGLFARHSDATHPFGWRQCSFLYYFHRTPKRFEGGELAIYGLRGDLTATDHPLVAVEPRDNRLVVFHTAATWHEVRPVRCDTGNLADGRFVLSGEFGRVPSPDYTINRFADGPFTPMPPGVEPIAPQTR